MSAATAARIGTKPLPGIRRLPAAKPSTALASAAISATTTSDADLKACLDILKQLQPKVSADIPSLFVAPPPPSSALKRKKSDEHDSGPSRVDRDEDQGHAAASKRIKRESHSPDHHATDRKASPSYTSTSSAAAALALRNGFRIRRADSPRTDKDGRDKHSHSPASDAGMSSTTGTYGGGGLVADDHISPLASLPSPTTTSSRLSLNASSASRFSLSAYSPDMYRRTGNHARKMATQSKRSADTRMRDFTAERFDPTWSAAQRAMTPMIAMVEFIDAILLFSFAFWMDDCAAGAQRSRTLSNSSSTLSVSSADNHTVTWKPGCLVDNWSSMTQLLAFVRARAEKLASSPLTDPALPPRFVKEFPRAMELGVAILHMVEALILQHVNTQVSRNLHAQAGRMLSVGPTSGVSPPGGDSESNTSGQSSHSAIPHATTETFLQNYLKMQGELEKIHSLWPSSQGVLLAGNSFETSPRNSPDGRAATNATGEDMLVAALRKSRFAHKAVSVRMEDMVMPSLPPQHTNAAPVNPEDLFEDGQTYFAFAWPIVLHAQNAIDHSASFGRAILSEIIDRLDLPYTLPIIDTSTPLPPTPAKVQL